MAVLSAAALALAACSSGAVTKEEEQVETTVAVQVGTVAKADLRAHVEAYGTIETEPAKAGNSGGGAKLAAPFAGIVHAVHAVEGQSVKAGDMVIQLDDRIANAAVDKARHALVFAKEVADRQDRLYAFKGTSLQAKQEAQQRLATAEAELAAAQAAIAQVQLISPLDGVVAHINVSPGQTVDLNTVVAEIVDLNRLVATLSIPADEAMRVKAAQTADIFIDYGKTPVTTGQVSFVSPTVDLRTASVLTRLTLPEDSGLRPGQFVRASIVTEVATDRLVVPREAVVRVEDSEVIYVVEGDKATQLPVKTKVREGNLVEVEAEGLKEGDMIVTVGAYGLPKETKITVAKH
jgi:membrane fusion protein (multidrug efflux system)